MLISTKGRYALRVMLHLASHDRNEYVSLSSIAQAEGISVKYLESIIAVLSKAHLLDGARGKGGGYRLNRSPDAYPLGEILRLTEKSLAPVSCLDCKPNPCEHAKECRTLPVWEKLDTLINEYLNSVTLADLPPEGS